MTKRKIKNYAPQGFNKSLGNSLVNKINSKNRVNVNILPEENEVKVVESITHESGLNELLSNIELADEKLETERESFILKNSSNTSHYLEQFSKESIEKLNSKFGHLLCIPRRPPSTSYLTADELKKIENTSFVDWKRSLAKLREDYDVVLTPYERNIELWRQLWRVIERSNVVLQIVDARNPLLFRNEDLEKFVKEVDSRKKPLLLVNKSDLLSIEQMQEWHNYFVKHDISAIFWSAIEASKNNEEDCNKIDERLNSDKKNILNDFLYVKSASELIIYLKKIAKQARPELSSFVIGMVGYPNVGKSQTINSLVGSKKTSVSATPGKTKHFQTLVIDKELTLCDCPGLVMPSFGFTTSEMILNAVLPISQMRDYFSPVQMLCNRVPRKQFETMYSIILPKSSDAESDKPPTAHDLLTTIAFMKGFMSAGGIPDCSRAARLVLKDVVNGKIKWVASPPGFPQEEFDKWTVNLVENHHNCENFGENLLQQLNKRNLLINNESKITNFDANFFNKSVPGVNYKRVKGLVSNTCIESKKHGNKNKREKLRRVFAHLDA